MKRFLQLHEGQRILLSREHLRISIAEGRAVVEGRSANGTRLDGVRLTSGVDE